jgi:hypothetical protein
MLLPDAEPSRRVGVPVRQERDVEVEGLRPCDERPRRVARDAEDLDAGSVEFRSPVTQELELVRSGRAPREQEEQKQRCAVFDEVGQTRRLAWREPDLSVRHAVADAEQVASR